MRLLRAPLLFCVLASSGLFVACDGAVEPVDRSDSRFSNEAPLTRTIIGRVYAGSELVEGAVVRMRPHPGFAGDELLADAGEPTWTTTTDGMGLYRFIRQIPLRYDLSFRRGADVAVYTSLSYRYIEPTLDEEGTARGWTVRIEPSLDPPLAPGQAAAFFVTGVDASTVAPVAAGEVAVPGETALTLTMRRFTTTVMLHAVVYPEAEGLAAAIASGSFEAQVSADTTWAPRVTTQPVTLENELTFDVTPARGFPQEELVVTMDLGLRTSQNEVARLVSGAPLPLKIVPFARYAVRTRAVSGGAVSDSRLAFFDPFAPVIAIEMPEPPTVVSPAGQTEVTLDAEGLLAIGKGVHEHLLVPEDGGATIRILTDATKGPAQLPDLTTMALPAARGRYTWTVTQWAGLPFVDNFSGMEVRALAPRASAAPRVLVVP